MPKYRAAADKIQRIDEVSNMEIMEPDAMDITLDIPELKNVNTETQVIVQSLPNVVVPAQTIKTEMTFLWKKYPIEITIPAQTIVLPPVKIIIPAQTLSIPPLEIKSIEADLRDK